MDDPQVTSRILFSSGKGAVSELGCPTSSTGVEEQDADRLLAEYAPGRPGGVGSHGRRHLYQVYNKLAVKAGRTSARLLVPAIAPFPSRVKPRTWPETRVADYSGAYAPHAHRLDLAFIQNAP